MDAQGLILGLPDEMLMEIFGYINYIPAKLELEQVCKQFQSVGYRSPSWKTIHKLEIMINCYFENKGNKGIVSLTGDCIKSKRSATLNGIKVSVKNWPCAIEALLKRTQIDQLLIHIGRCWPRGGANYLTYKQHVDIAAHLLDVFKLYSPKLRLNLIELHSRNDSNILDPIFFYCLEHCAQSIDKVTVVAERNEVRSDKVEEFVTLFWPLIGACANLKTFGFCTDCNLTGSQTIVAALVGKPLCELKIGVGEYYPFSGLGEYYLFSFISADNLAQIINMTNGQGIETLAIENFGYEVLKLKQLCDLMSEKARNKLKQLTMLDDREEGDGLIFKDLYLLPSMFPSLEKIDIYGGNRSIAVELHMDACMTQFFEIAHNSNPIRVVTLQKLFCEAIETFKTNLVAFCQVSGIDIHFGEAEPWAILSQGNATVIIVKAMEVSQENEMSEDMYYYNSDSDDTGSGIDEDYLFALECGLI